MKKLPSYPVQIFELVINPNFEDEDTYSNFDF
jgi:hypothetical protein